jgi:c-di-GMP-binding flagellar brake protein YcgR
VARFEDLKLLPGQPMQLDFEGYSNERDRSVLLGYRPHHSIIVTTPIINGSPMTLKLGMKLAVRLFAQQVNSACAFRSEILHVSRAPYAHIHLAMPDEVITGEVRKSVRARVKLIVSIHHGPALERQCSAMVTDLSIGGARICAKQLPVASGDQIRISAQLEVSGVERIISINGIVRSYQEEEGQCAIGVQFNEINDADRVMLHAYVLSSIHG